MKIEIINPIYTERSSYTHIIRAYYTDVLYYAIEFNEGKFAISELCNNKKTFYVSKYLGRRHLIEVFDD